MSALDSSWVSDVEQSLVIVTLIKVAAAAVGWTQWNRPPARVPGGALALLAVVGVPSVLQFAWRPLLTGLERRPDLIEHHHQYWRMVTSMVVQDGGVAGTAFNLVTLAVIATAACWFWGSRRAVLTFLLPGLAFNVVAVAYGSVGAGNSGATYGLAASIAGYLAVRASGRLRWAGLAAVGAGGAIWALGNLHGMAVLGGAVVGAAYAVAGVRVRTQPSERLVAEPMAV